MEEIIDIVDENDQKIGQESKQTAHQRGLLHRASAVLIFKDDSFKETLLQRRSKNKVLFPRLLAHLGGHLLAGETYLHGALRELQEELFYQHGLPNGIELNPLFKFIVSAKGDNEIEIVYRTVYPGPFFPDPEEVEECFWISLNALYKDLEEHSGDYSGFCRAVFQEYRKRINF